MDEMTDDSKLSIDNLEGSASEVAFIFNKYNLLLFQEKTIYNKLENELASLYINLKEYFMGRRPLEAGEEPFDIKILNNEVDAYIRAHPKYLVKHVEMKNQEELTNLLDKFVKFWHYNRSNNIKTTLDAIKFKMGA